MSDSDPTYEARVAIAHAVDHTLEVFAELAARVGISVNVAMIIQDRQSPDTVLVAGLTGSDSDMRNMLERAYVIELEPKRDTDYQHPAGSPRG